MNKILVTGAGGFIGRQTLLPLLTSGYEVHAASLVPADDSPASVRWYDHNLLDSSAMDDLIHSVRPTHLLHLAWYAVPGRFWTAVENLQWVVASLQLIQAFQKNGGQRAVFAGTCAEYEWGHDLCIEQETPLRPASLYGVSKNALQQIMSAFARQVHLSTAWGRVFHLYGPNEMPERFVPSVIISLLNGHEANCTEGKQIRDFMHVADVASAFVALISSSVEGPVNIASGNPVTLAGVAQYIAKQLGAVDRLRLGARPSAPDDPPVLVGATNRLASEVGWHPSIPLEDGLDATIEWWRRRQG